MIENLAHLDDIGLALVEKIIELGLEVERRTNPLISGDSLQKNPRHNLVDNLKRTNTAALKTILGNFDETTPVFSPSDKNHPPGYKMPDGWAIAPLANARGFIDEGHPNLGIYVAFMKNFVPEFGLCHFPHKRRTFLTHQDWSYKFTNAPRRTEGSFGDALSVRPDVPKDFFRIAMPERRAYPYRSPYITTIVPVLTRGGEAVCTVAEGLADFSYLPTLLPVELAAPQAIIRNAGGLLLTDQGFAIDYSDLSLTVTTLAGGPAMLQRFGFYRPPDQEQASAPHQNLA